LLNGIERADSITFDPHKWLFQPYEVGCLMVKDRRDLRGAFYLVPEYLKDTERDESEPNFYDYGIQLTRGFRGLKLWMSLKVFGLDAFREAVEWGFEQAELAETVMGENPRWEIFTHAHMGIINFRYIPETPRTPEQLDAIQQEIANGIVRSGYAMVATTVLKGRKVLRLALINPRTMEEEIEETIVRMAAIGAEL
jgi:glutamate/tyrosine decarboxylase-like PLP-dependent enzyme